MLGAALWVGTWVSLGYFAGEHITAIYTDVTRYFVYALIAAAVALAVWIGLRLRAARKRRAAAGGAGEQVEPQASDRS